jgi:succinoglycan biosynthesis protein ExoV
MKIFYYDHFPNYGDVLNLHIWPHLFAPFLQRQDDILMTGIGTLLGQAIDHQGRIIVCGSGCGYEPDVSRVKAYKIFWVRGPKSAALLGLPPDRAITDPAILIDTVMPPARPNGRVVFIPHYETGYNPLWRRACALAGIEYVDPLDDVTRVSAQLSSAKLVIAEAMHGAIVADAYRVPWLPVATSSRINLFKWQDWAESLNIRLPEFTLLPSLGYSDFFRNLTEDVGTAKSLQSNSVAQTEKQRLGRHLWHGLFNALPRKLRYKIEYQLIWKLGPWLDRRQDHAAAAGRASYRLEAVAAELRRLAALEGCLSSETAHQQRRAEILARITEVKAWLQAESSAGEA